MLPPLPFQRGESRERGPPFYSIPRSPQYVPVEEVLWLDKYLATACVRDWT